MITNGQLKLKLVFAALAALTALYASIVFSDELGEGNVDDEPPVALSPGGANIDSVYGVINAQFLALEPIWKRACYDCHSDKTVYPWYYKLPIVKGMIDEDISEARGELDMSNGFPFESQSEPVNDIRKLGEEVAEGKMPPGSYKFMHWSAKLSDEDKASVAAFVSNSLAILAAHGIKPSTRRQFEGIE